jgi:phosphoadenosine phosphosulfate reductase
MNIDLEVLNQRYFAMSPEERLKNLYQDFPSSKILVTSSFGTTSVYLLSLIRKVNPSQEIYFINTGYLFQETIEYQKQIGERLGLTILEAVPDRLHHQYSKEQELWKTNPDMCCSVNKVLPFESIKSEHDIWVSGLIRHQNDYRTSLDIFDVQDHLIKFHPIIDVPIGNVRALIGIQKLPIHPLVKRGFDSVGCTHCTEMGKGRDGRWTGKTKTECGLHLKA